MGVWMVDQHGIVHHFVDGVAACDAAYDLTASASDADLVCLNCVALAAARPGLGPTWVRPLVAKAKPEVLPPAAVAGAHPAASWRRPGRRRRCRP